MKFLQYILIAPLLFLSFTFSFGQAYHINDLLNDQKYYVGNIKGSPAFNDFNKKFNFTVNSDSTINILEKYNSAYFVRSVYDKMNLYLAPQNNLMIIERNGKEQQISYSGGDIYAEGQPNGENVFYSIVSYISQDMLAQINIISSTNPKPKVLPLKGTVVAVTNNYLYYCQLKDPDGKRINTLFRVQIGNYDKPEKILSAVISNYVTPSPDDKDIIVERISEGKKQRVIYNLKSKKASLIPFGTSNDNETDNPFFQAGVSFDLTKSRLVYYDPATLSAIYVNIPKGFNIDLH